MPAEWCAQDPQIQLELQELAAEKRKHSALQGSIPDLDAASCWEHTSSCFGIATCLENFELEKALAKARSRVGADKVFALHIEQPLSDLLHWLGLRPLRASRSGVIVNVADSRNAVLSDLCAPAEAASLAAMRDVFRAETGASLRRPGGALWRDRCDSHARNTSMERPSRRKHCTWGSNSKIKKSAAADVECHPYSE